MLIIIDTLITILTFMRFFNTTQLFIVKIIVLLLIMFLLLVNKKVQFNREVIRSVLLITLVNIIFMILGWSNGTRAFPLYWKVLIAEPLLYLFVFVPAVTYTNEKHIEKSMIFATIATLLLLSFAFVFYRIGGPLHLITSLPCTVTINNYAGYIAISSENLQGFFFSIPCIIVYFLDKTLEKKRRILLGILLLWAAFIALIVGRRALLVIIAISVFLYYFLHFVRDLQEHKIAVTRSFAIRFFAVIVLIILAIIVALKILSYFGSDIRLGNLSSTIMVSSDNIRKVQINSLLNGWKEAPIFGWGYAKNVDGNIRSSVDGMYEYSYLALLFQTGIVGCLCYLSFAIYFIKGLFREWKQSNNITYLSVLVGLICFLIANGTNPYLYSFDGLWCLFYPLALINKAILIHNEQLDSYNACWNSFIDN